MALRKDFGSCSLILCPFALFEISILSLLIYSLLVPVATEHASEFLLAVGLSVCSFLVLGYTDMPVLSTLAGHFLPYCPIVIVVLFQNELRRALSKWKIRYKRKDVPGDYEKFLHMLARVSYDMASKHLGAIIILENNDSLNQYAKSAIPIDAVCTAELLESLFLRLPFCTMEL